MRPKLAGGRVKAVRNDRDEFSSGEYLLESELQG